MKIFDTKLNKSDVIKRQRVYKDETERCVIVEIKRI